MHDAKTTHQEPRTDRLPRPFVGRDAELRAMSVALDSALAGTSQVILLAGEPGIGKTRTATEFADLAAIRGARVLWGSCYEWEGAPAYWPWTQVLSGWARTVDERVLSTTLGTHAALLAQLAPEVVARLPELPPLPPLEPEARRFRLLAAVSATLRAICAEQPVVIVLDDLHWADPPTLQLLLFIAQDLHDARLLIAATMRDVDLQRDHPGTSLLVDLLRQPYSRRLTLRGLPRPQVAQLVALITGQAQSPGLVDAVYSGTEGNPFFVTEVARLLAAEGQLDGGAADGFRRLRVPESVRDAINRRLEWVSPECTRALTVAAVAGREFDVRLLARATGTSPLDLLDTLDAAARAQLLVPGHDAGRYRFSHALVQETLYQDTSPSGRAQLHLAVGQALEAGADREPPWAELAYHYYHAGPLGEPDKVVHYSERAGDAAMAQYSWDAASAHYRHALDAMTRPDPAHRCELLLMLGEAQNRAGSGAGDAPAARASFLQAFELARELCDGERMARAAVGYAGINQVAVFGGTRQLELLEEAFAALDATDSPLRTRVAARLAIDLWHRSTANFTRARALAEEAVAAAERLGDPTILTHALNALSISGQCPDNLAERLDIARRVVVVAEQTGDPIAAAWGYILQLMYSIEASELFAAEQAMTWLQEFDERTHIPYISQRVSVCRVMLDLPAGKYADAAAHIERARALWQSTTARQHAAEAFLLYRDLGRLDELTEEIQLPDSLHAWRVAAQAHRMALALERGNPAAARADYDALVADDFARVEFNQHWAGVLAMLSEAAVAFDDCPRAARIHAWLEPYAERQVMDGSLGVTHGPVALYLGRLAGLLGRWDTALRWLERSRTMCEQLGLRPFTARTLLATAEVLARRDGPGDRAAALDLLQRAVHEAEAIGMLGLVPRVTALRDAITVVPPASLGLTPRETEVLRLIAQGLTDAEVAERLSLSPRTIGSHLTSIYGKLGVSSRTAAARIALEHGVS